MTTAYTPVPGSEHQLPTTAKQNDKHQLPITAKKNDKHMPKNDHGDIPVLVPHRGIKLLRYWPHVTPVMITAVLSALNLSNIYYARINDPSIVEKIGAFQFCAKVHELLITSSLGMMLLDRVRTGLLSQEGVPLGHLLCSWQLTDFLYYISSQFWTPLFVRRSSKIQTKWSSLTMLLLLAIPFAFVAGPLSAILVVPRLGWSKPSPAGLQPIFVNTSSMALWPSVVASPPNCNLVTAALTAGCPEYALENAFYTLLERYICSGNSVSSVCNSSSVFEDTGTSMSRTQSFYTSQPGTAVAMTSNDMIFSQVAGALATNVPNELGFSGSKQVDSSIEQIITSSLPGNKMYKAVVQTDCQWLSANQTNELKKGSTSLPSATIDWKRPGLYWVGGDDETTNPEALLVSPQDPKIPGQVYSPTPCNTTECWFAISCIFKPSWVPVKYWYDTNEPKVIYQDHPSPEEYKNAHMTDTKSVVFRRDWLTSLSTASGYDSGLSDFTLRFLTAADDWKSAPYPVPSLHGQSETFHNQAIRLASYSEALSAFISNVLVTSMADQQSNCVGPGCGGTYVNMTAGRFISEECSSRDRAFFGDEICAKPGSYWAKATSLDASLASKWTLITFSIQNYGYGWFFDSVTVIIAIAVLLTHAALTLAYLAALPLKKTISTCWDSVAELMVFGIHSLPPTKLDGVSAGVHDSTIWRTRVTVREVNGTRELSLVVGDSADYGARIGGLPQLSKKYH